MKKSSLCLAFLSVSFTSLQAGISHAQTFDEIIVTAERKETSLQRTPIAVSALTADDLETLQMVELQDIDANVPGMTIQGNVASSTALAVTLRGSSEPNAAFLFSEPGIGLYMNGVYRRLNAGNLELADIERIEVLRGPQGTLFGRNTLAGAMNVVTRKPSDEFKGELSASYDSFETLNLRGSVGGAISDNMNASIAAVYRDRNQGPFTNRYNDTNIGKKEYKGIQGNLLWNIGDDSELSVSVYATEDENDGSFGAPVNLSTGEFVFPEYDVFAASTVNGGVAPFSKASQFGFDAALTVPLTESITLKYIPSYNQTDSSWGVDFTSGGAASGFCQGLTCIPAFFRESDGEQEQTSHELQLLGETGNLDWIVGLYYFDETTNQAISDEFFGFATGTDTYDLESQSLAVFGQASYQLTDQLALTAGGRYTKDNKDFSGVKGGTAFATDPDWNEFTAKLGAEYQVNDDILTYVTWSQGFKAGTFNAFAPAAFITTPLEPETVDSLEFGFKGNLLDDRLKLNAALYSAKYKDLVVGGLGASGLFTANGGETDIRGLEVESAWLMTDSFKAFLTLNYLIDSDWDDTSGSASTRVGDDLPYSKEFQWTLGGTYTHDMGDKGSIGITPTVQFDDEFYSVATHQNNPIELVDDRTVVNLQLNYTTGDEKHRFWLNGKNIFDDVSYNRVANFNAFLPTNTVFVAPNPGASVEVGYKRNF